MYTKLRATKTNIKRNESYQGETIEKKIRRIVNNKEPITDGAPLIYTDRKDGVRPEMDIRTDRFEIAVDAMDKVTKSHLARREERHNPKEDTKKGGESTENKGSAETAANTSDTAK